MDDRINGSSGSAQPAQPTDPDQHAQADPQKRGGRTRAQERIDALDTAGAASSARVEELTAELEAARREAAEAKAGWQRSVADFTNYRRRTEQERQETLGLAADSLLLKVLSIADDLDRAIEHTPAEARGSAWLEGIEAIDRKLRGILDSEGVTALETEGKPFDPREHQAVVHEDTRDAPDGVVLYEIQRGYRVRDRVLRPALVAVARNEAGSSAGATHDDNDDNDAK